MLMKISQLTFCYGAQTVLRDIDCELKSAEVVALVGANGSGKTTLMQLMLGELQPRCGKILPDSGLLKVNSIAYLPDKPPLYPDWTVREFLVRLAADRKISQSAVEEVLQRCGLQDVQDKACRALSHGYRQRTSLAQALLHRPKVLFMDEPMNGLDAVQRGTLRHMIAELASEGMSIVLSLHDLDDVVAVAHRVWYLQDARLFDLPLPGYEKVLMWAVFASAEPAQAYDCVSREGNVCGFSQTQYRRDGMRLLHDPALVSLGRQYPPAALLARMAECQ